MTQTSPQRLKFSSRGEGPIAVVFIHGFLDAGAIWQPVIEATTYPDVQKVTLDLPGMGADAAAPGPFSYARYAQDVGDLVRSLDKPVVLVGQSMGAVVAELVADEQPSVVWGIVLVTPVPLAGIHGPAEAIDPFRALGGQPGPQRQTRKYLSPGISEAALDELRVFGEVVLPATAVALVNTWNDGAAPAATPSRFAGPVLVIRGADDPLVVDALAHVTAARYPGARVEAVANAGHWAHFEQAPAVAKLIDAFLGAALSSAASTGGTASDWRTAFEDKKRSEFAAAFAEEVVFEASVMRAPVVGRSDVSEILENASALYEKLVFTEEVKSGNRQYLQWEARLQGGVEVSGVTILTRNDAGAIAHIAIHHRPLDGLLFFSETLGARLPARLAGDLFVSKGSR